MTSASARLKCFLAISLVLATFCLKAEDADRPRGYLQFRSGEFDSRWGVHDSWGLSGGMNLNRYFGAEVAGDVLELYTDLGEVAVTSLLPQVRLRYPMLGSRLVPYALAGAGPAYVQFNDPRAPAFGREVQFEGWSAAASLGAGLEYFLADNITFALEGKYIWMQPVDRIVDGQKDDYNPSSFLASIGLRVYFKENRPQPLVQLEETPPTRFYAAARFGGSILTDAQLAPGVRLRPESSGIGDTIDQYPSLSLGADLGEHWGAEITLGNMEHVLHDETRGGLGEYSMFSGLAQARYRVPLVDGRWVPYVTGGMGVMYSEWNDSRTSTFVKGKGVYPLAAAGTGIEYFIARNFSLSADAWWQYSWGHRIQIVNRKMRGDFSSFQAQLGFRIYFLEL